VTGQNLGEFTVTGTLQDSFGNFLVDNFTGLEIQELIAAAFPCRRDAPVSPSR